MDKAGEMAVFIRVVDEGGFSSAARALKLTPSAVSKHITRLEDRLGVRLLNRTTRRLSMTEEGKTFYERSARILADIEETELIVAEHHSSPRGMLRLTCGNSFGRHQISPLISEFLERYPEMGVEMYLTDNLVDLVEDGMDVAIRFGELSDSSLISRNLTESRRAILASPEYLERHGVPMHPKDLHDHNCLTFVMYPKLNEWVFRLEDGSEYPYRAHGNFTTNNGEAIHQMALDGLGIARLAKFLVAEDVRHGRLVKILEPFYRDTTIPINAVYPSRRHLSPKVRAFVDFLVEKFNPLPPWER